MTTDSLRLIVAGLDAAAVHDLLAASPHGPFEVESAATAEELGQRVQAQAFAAALVALPAGPIGAGRLRMLAALAGETAVLVVPGGDGPDELLALLRAGVEDVLGTDEIAGPGLPRRIRAAVERRRLAREARTAYATDLGTGLPHQQQLIEHMSHLMALREREPAPMAVLVLRIEGLATAEARFGREAANVLRRKLAVRLRGGVRASDVVASIGPESFAVLLASILAPADALRVGAKLLAAVQLPFKLSGQEMTVAAALGIGQYPSDGTQPDALLRRATGLAASATALERVRHAGAADTGGRSPAAANDE